MTFDNLISILLFIFFIVIPIVSRLNRANRPPAQQARPDQPRSGQPVSGQTQPGQQPVRSLVSSDEQRRPTSSEFAKRLEEARRRVQEAQGGAVVTEEAVLPPESRPSQSSAVRDLDRRARNLSASAQRDAAPQLSRRGAASQTARKRRGDMDRGSLQTPQAPLRVARRRSRRLAHDSQAMIRLNSNDVRRGFLWHFILEEPKAKELTRRRLSQRPSR